jgi:hypothetical protein
VHRHGQTISHHRVIEKLGGVVWVWSTRLTTIHFVWLSNSQLLLTGVYTNYDPRDPPQGSLLWGFE